MNDQRSVRPWRLQTTGTIAFSWFVVIAAFIHPPHGMGVPLCFWHRSSGIRCPGCGLSRSISCLAHGQWEASLHYHPLGSAILALCAAVAMMSIVRRPTRGGHEPKAFRLGFACFAATFIMVGVVRALADMYAKYVQ